VVAALMSPLVYISFGWLSKRVRRLRQRWAQRKEDGHAAPARCSARLAAA